MATYNAVRLDKMYGTTVGTGLVNFVYEPSATATAIENGMAVKVTGKKANEREIYVGGVPAVDTDLEDILLVASVEYVEDERLKNLTDFRNEVGDICRGYRLHTGDFFSVTQGCLSGTSTNFIAGAIVELTASNKWGVVTAVAGVTAGSTQVGVIDAVENDGVNTWYVIEVI